MMALEGGMYLGGAYAKILLDQSDFDAGIEKVKNSLTGSLQSIGSNLSTVGSSLTLLGAPLAAAFGASVKTAMDFDTALHNIAAVLSLTKPEMDVLAAQLKEVGENSTLGATAVANAYYDIAGGVADASTHMAILNAAVKTAEAGNADLAGTTNALVSIMNAYNLKAEDAAMVSDVLTRTVGMGVGTMDQFASALPNVTGLANSLGIEFEDLGGMMAYLTTKGNSASEASTQLSGMMTAILKPNEKMMKGLKELGFQSGEAAIKQLGLLGAYKALQGTQTGTTEGMAALTGAVEALRGVTSFGGDDVQGFFDKYSAGVAGATDAARAIQNESMEAKWETFNAQIQDVAITLGNTLFPILTDLFENLKPIIGAIGDWIAANPEIVQAVALFVGGLVTLGPILMGIGAAIGAVGALLAVLFSPITLIIGAVAALAAAYYTNFGGVRDFIDGQVRPVLEAVFNWLADVWETRIKPGIQGLYDWFVAPGGGLDSIRAGVEYFWNNILTPFIDVIAGIWDSVVDGVTKFADWFIKPGGGLDSITKFLSDFKTNAIDPVIKVIQDIWTKVQPFLEGLKTGMKAVFDWIKTNVIDPALTFIDGLIKKIHELLGVQNQEGGATRGNVYDHLAPRMGTATNPPGMAYGGVMQAGMPYVTGERGPEVVIPQVNSQVIPNGQGAGGGMTLTGDIYINADTEAGGRAAARGFKEELDDLYRGRGNF